MRYITLHRQFKILVAKISRPYRLFHQLADLGCCDLDLDSSTVCRVLLGLIGIWQNRLSCLASWWNIQIKVNKTHELMDQSVVPTE